MADPRQLSTGPRACEPLGAAGADGAQATIPGAPEPPPPGTQVGYPSRVCSTLGDAIQRIAAAIDQLATDTKGTADEQELTARVASLWQMVSDLDPELARRARAYGPTADGAPSA
jgi:hypothetical protein